MTEIPFIAFSPTDNAYYYTGSMFTQTDTLQRSASNWFTGGRARVGDYRLASGGKKAGVIDGSRVLFSPPNTYAVVQDGVNFEHIWSAWRGGREMTVANVDDGALSLRDLIDFHEDEVFSTVEIIGVLQWVDENTIDLSNGEIRLGTKDGWTLVFDYNTSETVIRSGGDNQTFVNGVVKLNKIQFTDENGSTAVYEDGEETGDKPEYYDDKIVGQTPYIVQSQIIKTVFIEPRAGAVDERSSTNYPENEYVIKMTKTENDIETEADEEQYRVFLNDRFHGLYPTRDLAEIDYQKIIDGINDDMKRVNNKQKEANKRAKKSKSTSKGVGVGGQINGESPEWLLGGLILAGLIVLLSVAILGVKDDGE